MELSRYFTYSAFENVLNDVVSKNNSLSITKKVIGESVEGRLIYGLEIGEGDLKILAWSQMHGNESTTTRALIKLLDSDFLAKSSSNIKLYIIPVLNPDGLEKWSRLNASGVDLNRDALELTQPESKILRQTFDQFQPDYCLNLHGQRTIYGNMDGSLPAQMSFLAPAGDSEKSIKPARLKSMNLINHLVSHLKLGNAIIGRYSDDFNINCVGDYFTSLGVPTILFEAGHAGNDYSRNHITIKIYEAIRLCIDKLAQNLTSIDKQATLECYESIPSIANNFTDVLLKNVPDYTGDRYDLSILYVEEIKNERLHFVPVIAGVNDVNVLNAHRIIDLLLYEYEDVDFHIDEYGVFSTTTFEISIFCK